MIIGVPKETKNNEKHVALTPSSVPMFINGFVTYHQPVVETHNLDYKLITDVLGTGRRIVS